MQAPLQGQIVARATNKRLTMDQNLLTEILWRHQETQLKGPIEEPELHYLTGWGYTKFKHVLNTLLENPQSGVIRTPSGRIEYTW